MVLSNKEVESRKDRILGIVVEQYIHTVAPVGSAIIVKEHSIDLSSATIRNILAELEAKGYLSHPHTSAGRIPTQKGYRYYVDNLMHEIQLLEEEQKRIRMECANESRELEELLDKTSRVLSDTTHYTSIISVDGWGSKIFCRGTNFVVNYPDQQDIEKIESILTALDEKERLIGIINRDLRNKIDVLIGHELSCQEINSCSLVIASYKLKQGPTGKIAILGPTRMDYERVVSTLHYFTKLMEEIS